MANSSTTSKPPPSGKIAITLSYELLKKIRPLNTKLAEHIRALKKEDELQDESLVHVVLTADDEKKLEDASLVQQELPLDETRKIFSFLCAQVKNKTLKAKEILAIEEYKIALLEGCRTSISNNSIASFRLRKRVHTPVVTLKTVPSLKKLELVLTTEERQKNPKQSRNVTLEQLNNDFDLVVQEENKRKENNEKHLEIDTALKTYKNKILHEPLYQNSGKTENYTRVEAKKSAWKKIVKRVRYTLPLVSQLISTAAYNGVELLGANSLLLLIPNITTPLVWTISIAFIVLSWGIDISFSLKAFKETYGFSYLWRKTKTFLEASEKIVALTHSINDLLLDNHGVSPINSTDYKQYTDIARLANKDVERKVANADSPFVSYNEQWWRQTIRIGMTAINALTAITGAYFLATLLVSMVVPLLPVAAAVFVAAWPVAVALVVTVPFAALSIYLFYHLYKSSAFNMVNPLAERFNNISKSGNALADKIEQRKSNFDYTLTVKTAVEQGTVLKPLFAEKTKTVAASSNSVDSDSDSTSSRKVSLSGKSSPTLYSSNSRSASTDSLTDEEVIPKVSPRSAVL